MTESYGNIRVIGSIPTIPRVRLHKFNFQKHNDKQIEIIENSERYVWSNCSIN